MASMRRVTRKPPKMLMPAMKMPRAASMRDQPRARSDLHQRAENDDRRDRVGHRHQRRVQRMRHVPDHLEADEHRQHEDDEVLHEARRRDKAPRQHQRTADGQQRDLLLGLRLEGGNLCARFSSGVSSLTFSFGFGRDGLHLGRRRREGDLAMRNGRPRITSSSML
jgi:hypothetical protein